MKPAVGRQRKTRRDEQMQECLADTIKPYLNRINAIRTAMTLIEWDNETGAPKGAAEYTANVQGVLAAEYQRAVLEPDFVKLARRLKEDRSAEEAWRAMGRILDKEISKLEKIPIEEYENYNRILAQAAGVWQKAKKENDYGTFAPYLELIIEYGKKFAALQAKEGQKLYDVMLEEFEEGFTMEVLDSFFAALKEKIVPLLKKVQAAPQIDAAFLHRKYDREKQKEFCLWLAEYLDFDSDRGLILESEHPFTTNLHNHDVRMTTHYYEDAPDSAIFSLIHETGHALYEQDIDDELTQTPVGGGSSMGMHESQSRFYENILGRSEAFWAPVYQKLTELFPEQLGDVTLCQFIRGINRSEPGLIRTEADELTYCLHIMVRYEIEKMIFEENVNVDKLPGIWADKYEEYLGIRPENDAEGILQDIHWANGSFGYFPSYALGTAISAQIYHQMCKDLPVEALLREGKPDQIHGYLKEKLHHFGAVKKTGDILKEFCGEGFNPEYYTEYLERKFTELYGV